MTEAILTDNGYTILATEDVVDFVTDLYEVFLLHADYSKICGAFDVTSARTIFACTLGGHTRESKLKQNKEADNVITPLHNQFTSLLNALRIVKIDDYVITGRHLRLQCVIRKP